MSIYRRNGSDVWWVKFQAGGQRYQRSSGSTKKREAEAFERQLREAVADHATPIKTTNKSYSEALIRWVDEGAPKSMHSHARNTRPHLDNVPLRLVPKAANEMKQAMLRAGLKPTTINRRLAVVKSVLNKAYREWDWLEQPLAEKVIKLSERGMEREFYLSKEEVDQLTSHLSGEAKSVTLIAAYTGLRKGEILSLKPSNWQKPYIVLTNKTKSKKPRTVPVIEDLHSHITPPFSISEYELRAAFENAREAINRAEIRFHDLRHTYASWLVSQPNIPMATVRDLLGHSSLAVTSKYSHLRGNTFDIVTNALS